MRFNLGCDCLCKTVTYVTTRRLDFDLNVAWNANYGGGGFSGTASRTLTPPDRYGKIWVGGAQVSFFDDPLGYNLREFGEIDKNWTGRTIFADFNPFGFSENAAVRRVADVLRDDDGQLYAARPDGVGVGVYKFDDENLAQQWLYNTNNITPEKFGPIVTGELFVAGTIFDGLASQLFTLTLDGALATKYFPQIGNRDAFTTCDDVVRDPADGSLYVVAAGPETFNNGHNLCKLSAAGNVLWTVMALPTGGDFSTGAQLYAVTLDSDGNVYVAGSASTIEKRDAAGNLLEEIATDATVIRGLAFDSDDILYAVGGRDADDAHLWKLDVDGNELGRFNHGPSLSVLPEDFNVLYDVRVTDDAVYVTGDLALLSEE